MTLPWLVMFVLLWLVVLTLFVVVVGLSSQVKVLQLGDHQPQPQYLDIGPKIGSTLPSGLLDLPQPNSTRLVLFMSSTCSHCQKLAEELSNASLRPQVAELDVMLVTDERGQALYRNIRLAKMVDGRFQELSRELSVMATPFCFSIDSAGVVLAKGVPQSIEDLSALSMSVNAGRPTPVPFGHK